MRGVEIPPQGPDEGAGAPPVLCVVDGDAAVRAALGMTLRSIGFEVRTYESGAAFMLSGAAHACQVLIADIHQPGMGGLELPGALREAGIRLPIVFMAAAWPAPVREAALAAGAVAVLDKPVDAGALLQAVRAALGRTGD